MSYGHYSVLRVVDHTRVTEHCNVGVVLFDQDGKNMSYKADTNDRALRMGVMQPEWAETWTILDFEQRLKGMQDLDQLKKTLESMGHAMSFIQFREPLPFMIREGDLESLFNTFVLGKKHEPRTGG